MNIAVFFITHHPSRMHHEHHLTASTPADFTSAPKGMSIYEYIPQYYWGSLALVGVLLLGVHEHIVSNKMRLIQSIKW